MAGMLRKGMSWLGLGPEEDYDDYYDDGGGALPGGYDEVEAEGFDDAGVSRVGPPSASAPARPRAVPTGSSWDDQDRSGLKVLPSGGAQPVARGSVRPLPVQTSAAPQVVTPREFNDAQQVGDVFKRGRPVVLNLQGLDRDLARRLLDFTSGVAYGLGGRVEKAASHVYLLSPVDVEISEDDRRRIRDGDFDL